MNIDDIIESIDSNNLNIAFGRVVNISAVTLSAVGLDVAVGDIVRIESVQKLYTVLGMVTTLSDGLFVIVPFSFIDGFKINDKVFLQRDGLTIKCGNGLLGRVVNALGEPIDDLGKIRDLDTNSPINKESMSPLDRGIIDQKFGTGVKAIDSMLTCGKGQKVGIFAGSGVGITAMEVALLLVGCIVAFVVSVIAIKFLMGYIKKNDFKVFGYYRVVLGILVLAYFAITALVA